MRKRKTCPQRKILLFVALAICPAISCSARKVASSSASAPTAPSASHALQDIRIREIMGRLALPIDRMPQEVNPAAHRQGLLDEMAVVAKELEENAERIPEVLKNVQMSETHRMEFLDYARRLALQAAELGDRAKHSDLAAAREAFDEIDQICQSCHERFRILPLHEGARSNGFLLSGKFEVGFSAAESSRQREE